MTAPRSVLKGRPRRRLVLERMERRDLMATFSVTNNGDVGNGTLRQAIISANALPGPDLIDFSLATGMRTIQPLTELPPLSDPGTVIDATTQPGYAGAPLVTLDGSMLAANATGLTLTGGNGAVRGLVINNFSGAGGTAIAISGGGRNVISGNYIGTNLAGLAALPNGSGIVIGSANNTIGGTAPNQRNVISGNTFTGISVGGFATTGNVILGNFIGLGANGAAPLGNGSIGIVTNAASGTQIGGSQPGAGNVISQNSSGVIIQGTGVTSTTVQGNFIGTDASGTLARPNTFDGLLINGGANNLIGGLGNARNVISGNGRTGISLQGATARNNQIRNNFIGVAANGTSPLGNATEGVSVNGAINAVIGGFAATEGNVIAFNGSLFNNFGVNVLAGSSIAILSNSIFSNVGGGINISTGSNGNQRAPLITAAQTGANQVDIRGQLVSNPNTDYTIQFFSNTAPAPAGREQGQTFLGSILVTTDPSGLATFSTRLSGNVAPGQFLTATATESGTQNTSEFSTNVPITPAPVADLSVTIVAAPTPDLLLGAQQTYTITVTNNGPQAATGVQLTSSLDTNSTYVSGTTDVGTISELGGVVTADIGILAPNQSATITIIVTASDVGTIQIDSIVAGNEIDANSTNNAVSQVINVLPAADLAVTINPTPNPVAVNGSLTYTITVTNNGPSVATNVILTENLPGSVTIVSADSNDGLVTQTSGSQVVLNVDFLPVNTSATLTIIVTPGQVGAIVDTATVSSDVGDQVTANNTQSSTVNVARSADLMISGTVSPNPATVNQPFTYTFLVGNGGPFDATGVVFTDVLPANVTFVSASVNGGPPTGSLSGNTVTVPLPTILSGGQTIVTVTVVASTSTSLTNSASVNNTVELDANLSNNATTVGPVLVSPADLAVTLVASANPATLNRPFTYTLTVKNNGPATATNVLATQALPSGVTIGQVTSTNGVVTAINGTTLTAQIASLAPGAQAVITVVVTPTSSVVLTSTATVNPLTTTEFDPTPDNNTATATTSVSPADLGVLISASSATPLVGDPLTYNITAFSGGPATADNVRVSGTLPSNVRFVGITGGTITFVGNTYTIAFGQLAPNTAVSAALVVAPTATGAARLTATVLSDNLDPNADNNTATSTVTAINLPGTFGLNATAFTVNENAGSITLTVNRTKGTLGAVSVSFATSDGTALAGLNYVATSGVVNFADGQSTATITIPILVDNLILARTLSFNVALTAVSGGGTIDPAASSAVVTVANTDVDLVAPTVRSITPVLAGRSIRSLVITFSESIDPTAAASVANYRVFTSNRDGRPSPTSRSVLILAALYDDNNRTVTLVFARPLASGRFYGLSLTSASLTDIFGNPLTGTGAAGNFGAIFGAGTNLTYLDSQGDSVNLKLTRGGTIALTRFANGDADVIQLLNIVRRKSRLTGSVKRARRGDGLATYTAITGLGNFGDVFSTLSTPPFVSTVGGTTTTPPVPGPITRAALPRGPLALNKAAR